MTTRRLKITSKSFKRERMLETHLSLQRLDAQRRSRASILIETMLRTSGVKVTFAMSFMEVLPHSVKKKPQL